MRRTRHSREAAEADRPAETPPEPASARSRVTVGDVYVGGVIVSGAAIAVHSAREMALHPVGLEWLIFIALTIASGWATLRIPGMPISFSISDIFSIAAALVFGPAAGALTAVVDGLVLSMRMATSQRTVQRLAFNASAPSIAIWTAAHAYVALAGPRPQIDGPAAAFGLLFSLLVFAVVDYGLNTGIVAAAVSLERQQRFREVWRQHFAGLWLSYFGGAFGGLLVMLLARLHTIDVIILLIPLPVILYTAFRHAVGRTQDQISHLGKVHRVYVAAIEALAQAVDAKDQVTHDHVRRVQDRSVELARMLGVVDEGEIQAIKAASLLHDVGKLAIPEHILNKPGRLTPAEFEIMKRHAPIGADILSVIDFPYPVAPIVRHHHENWDGTGYPDGVAGDRIPIGARIISVVDCFDALTSDRPYRARMSDADALQILAERKGTMYDPRVVDAFFAVHHAEPPADVAPLVPAMPSAVAVPPPPAPNSADSALPALFALGYTVGDTSSSRLDLAACLYTQLRGHLPPATITVYRYDAAADALIKHGEAGVVKSGIADDTAIPLGERVSGWVAASGQPAMNSDARLDLDEPLRDASPLASVLSVPVASGARVLGVISIYAVAADAFEERHRQLMLAVAASLSTSPRDLWCAATAHQTPRMKHAS